MTTSIKVREYTEQLNQQGLLRAKVLSDSSLLSFDSNDYLSFLGDKRIAQAYEYGFKHYASGSGASMLLSGYHVQHKELEEAFAQLLEVDACVVFSSGYAANLALTRLLGTIGIQCIIDKGIHASMYDGLSLSQASYIRFLHNDLASLVGKLNQCSDDSVVITEGIFSMSGQMAPLSSISQLSQNKVPLLVDEAHSFGVVGEQGKGAISVHQLTQGEVPLRVISFGKAFAAQGAIIAGKQEWINAVLQAGRSIIYSTAISPAFCYGLLKTLELVVAADDRREKLNQLIDYFKNKISVSPLTWSQSDSAIQQLQLGCPHRALVWANKLKTKGLACSAIRTPTVNRQSTGLRIVLNYCHTPEQIDTLFTTLHSLYEY